jgi:hypothetical protein
MLLAAQVLLAPTGCIQIIDEPERHLHRSISSALIESVMNERPDCHFVILTHDLDLAASLPAGSTTLEALSGCAWSGSTAIGWNINSVDPTGVLPESSRRAILGGRRRLLFLEGDANSLDSRLYALLLPQWTPAPVGGCEEVIRAVVGLQNSDTHHWIEARGIVDGDGRSPAERETLAAKGVLALPVHEIESLYYTEVLLRSIAQRQADVLDKEASQLYEETVTAALEALKVAGTPERLAAATSVQITSRMAFDGLPDARTIAAGADPIEISLPSPYPDQLALIQSHLAANDLEAVVRAFPIRETSLRAVVAKTLGFQTYSHYETAARSQLRNEALADALRAIVGPLQ